MKRPFRASGCTVARYDVIAGQYRDICLLTQITRADTDRTKQMKTSRANQLSDSDHGKRAGSDVRIRQVGQEVVKRVNHTDQPFPALVQRLRRRSPSRICQAVPAGRKIDFFVQ